jgi:hypothetical protein
MIKIFLKAIAVFIILIVLSGCGENKINSLTPTNSVETIEKTENIEVTKELMLKYYNYFSENQHLFNAFYNEINFNSFNNVNQIPISDLLSFSFLEIMFNNKDLKIDNNGAVIIPFSKVDNCINKFFNTKIENPPSKNEHRFGSFSVNGDNYNVFGFGLDAIWVSKLTYLSKDSEKNYTAEFDVYQVFENELAEKEESIDFSSEILKEKSKYLIEPKKIKLIFKEIEENNSFYLQYISLENIQ